MYTTLAFLALSALSVSALPPTEEDWNNRFGQQKLIFPNGNNNKCLTAAFDGDGAPVTIEDCSKFNNNRNQLWTVQDGTFRIFGNKCLDDTNGVTTNGKKMQIWTCFKGNRNQQWAPNRGAIRLFSAKNKCLDNTNGSFQNGNPAQIWDCTGGPNQRWTIADAKPVSRRISIRPGKSDRTCLTASNNTDGAPVIVRPCDNSSGQRWNRIGNTFVAFDNKCLDVTNGVDANGTKMQIWTCNRGNRNQQFDRTKARQIIWENQNKCVDLTNGDLRPGNRVQIWQCTNRNQNQVWNFFNE